MPYPKCLMTGCELYLPDEGKWVHGDLHQSGSALVFNAVLNEKGETAWQYEEPPKRKTVFVGWGFPYFEKRGVIVFDKWHAKFSEEAKEYIGKWG